jgi:hypothetical protein
MFSQEALDAAEAAHVKTSQAITHIHQGVKSPDDADRIRGLAEDAAEELRKVADAMLALVVSGPVEA